MSFSAPRGPGPSSPPAPDPRGATSSARSALEARAVTDDQARHPRRRAAAARRPPRRAAAVTPAPRRSGQLRLHLLERGRFDGEFAGAMPFGHAEPSRDIHGSVGAWTSVKMTTRTKTRSKIHSTCGAIVTGMVAARPGPRRATRPRTGRPAHASTFPNHDTDTATDRAGRAAGHEPTTIVGRSARRAGRPPRAADWDEQSDLREPASSGGEAWTARRCGGFSCRARARTDRVATAAGRAPGRPRHTQARSPQMRH